jgi:prephenate dehydratase
MPASYAYLGPEGTFTEVALRTLPEAATRELIPYVSVQSALDAVRTGEAEAAFVPIENSVEGGITTTLDELVAGAPLMIYREVLLSITFALLVRPGTKISDIKTVSAHPAAQPQVRNWMKANIPDALWESAASNADAARLVQEGRYDAAFAGEFAAARYGLEALETEIHDAENAQTRFVLVGRPARPAAPTGADKTSVVIWQRDDHPGGLRDLLGEFATRGINLMLLQSRPTGAGIGNYCFCIDAEGHISDRRVAEALAGSSGSVSRCASSVRTRARTSAWTGCGRCSRGPRTRSSWRRPTGSRTARTAVSDRWYLCGVPVLPAYLRYPQKLSTGPLLDLGTSRQRSAIQSTNLPTGRRRVHRRVGHSSSTCFLRAILWSDAFPPESGWEARLGQESPGARNLWK